MDFPDVSVCVASYNHENYVAECIESALRQTVEPVDIVIVDDCSTDATADVVARYTDPRIKLIRHEVNLGISAALNHAVAHAKGDYICIVGSDDRLAPNKIERQQRHLAENAAVGIAFSFIQLIDECGAEIPSSEHPRGINVMSSLDQLLRNFFLGINTVAAPSAMIKRAVFDRIGYFDKRLLQTQDLDFWIRAGLVFDVSILPEALLYYRIRDNRANLSAGTPEKSARTLWEFRKVLQSFRAIDREVFFRVFPEAEPLKNSGLTVDALLAHHALAQEATHTLTFGLDLLHEILASGNDQPTLDAAGLGYRHLFKAATSAAVVSQQGYNDVEQARDWWHQCADKWAEQSAVWQQRALALGWRDKP